VESHNCRANDLVYYGKTVRGNDVYINHTVATADKVVLTGGICYHTFAGFGGGRKSIAPGVAGFSTIEGNHQNCFDKTVKYGIDPHCNSGILEDNPGFRGDVRDCRHGEAGLSCERHRQRPRRFLRRGGRRLERGVFQGR
jgi:nickel-dependent lactate racemase